MYFVTKTSFQRFLILGVVECSGGIKFGVQFQPIGKVMTDNESGEPSIRTLVNQVVASFPIYVDGTQFFGKFDRQDQACTLRSNPSLHRVIRIVDGKLRKNRHGES